MDDRQLNLLPLSRQKLLANEYRIRVGTVIAFAVTGLCVAAALLLLPAYVFLAKSSETKQAHLASIESTLAASDETELFARLKRLADDALALRVLKDTDTSAQTIGTILDVARANVTISGFSYTPTVGKAPQSVAVSGIALTRDALRKYQLALQGAQGVASAVLPVSAYAKDANIPFVITVVFSL
jgi:hypothetical protein